MSASDELAIPPLLAEVDPPEPADATPVEVVVRRLPPPAWITVVLETGRFFVPPDALADPEVATELEVDSPLVWALCSPPNENAREPVREMLIVPSPWATSIVPEIDTFLVEAE